MDGRVALIGKPLRRRHGVVMHNAAFAACGMTARADLIELDAGELPGFVETMKGPGWLGFQVTSPYKQSIMALLDRIEDDAMSIGAVNSGVRDPRGELIGFNTDMPGWLDAVQRDLSFDVSHASVFLLGAGGVAHAIAYGCVSHEADVLTIADRTPERAQVLAAELGGFGTDVAGTGIGTGRAHAALRSCDLVVNATTVGMTSPGPLVDVAECKAGARVYDVVFSPAKTELVLAARSRGLLAVNGGGMLVSQATRAFERWTGRKDMYGVMERAVRPLLSGSTRPDPSERYET